MSALHEEIRRLLNKHSRENESGTPDYILADFLTGCLDTFELAVMERDEWWGFTPQIGGTVAACDVDVLGDGSVTKRRCHDCQASSRESDMVPIKAVTLSGRAFICEPCHRSELARLDEANRRIQARIRSREATNE